MTSGTGSLSENALKMSFRPSEGADGVEAFGIVDQIVNFEEQSIASALLNHGISFRVRDSKIFMPIRRESPELSAQRRIIPVTRITS
jgi:hypothetical protein